MDRAPEDAHAASSAWWPVLLVPVLGLALAACGAVLVSRGPAMGTDPAALVGLAAAVLGCAVVAGWGVAAALAVLAVLAGRHRWHRLGSLCRRCSPALLRRAAAAALGVQLIAAPGAVADDAPTPFWPGGAAVADAPAAAAAAAPGAQPPGAPGAGPADAPGVDPGAAGVPADPPGAPALPAPTTPPAGIPHPSERTVDGAVTVLRGDTLWSLAAARLGPGACAEQVARAWPEWYALNRHVLPDGPHRILPGQRLLVPGDSRSDPDPTTAAPRPGDPS